MKWYEYDEAERVKKVYSKYTIKDFWDWWSGGEDKVMEVRIKDIELIKEVAKTYGLNWTYSGVYIWNHILLKKVIAAVRDKATVWFGIQPRKKNWNKYGKKSFGGKDVNVQEIGFIFIDIDRVIKNGVATNNDLRNADILADKILEKLATEKWNNSYLKICSGHGLQLIIKLDFPILMPSPGFNEKLKVYEYNRGYEELKKIVAKGIGADIVKFGKQFQEELGVEIDKTCFSLSRVGALPVTKNFKYKTFRWRSIVEMKDKPNDGFSDYVLSKIENIKKFKEQNVFFKSSAHLPKTRIRKGKLMEHKLVKFMLENDFPEGGINNTLWFQLKILLRDAKFDIHGEEYKQFHQAIMKKHNRTFSENVPDKKFSFNENVINAFCVRNLIPPLYEYLPKRKNELNHNIKNLSWNYVKISTPMKLDEHTDIDEDMAQVKKSLKKGFGNKEILGAFLAGMLEKYGEEKTKYYHKYVFERYFGYV